jgi:hypothetical protein
MMKKTIKNEHGFVLITSLLMLTVLMIIGIAATNTTTIELQISGNDKVAKQTFYQAEAGTQVGIELVEDSIDRAGYGSDDFSIGTVLVKYKDFYMNENPTPATPPTDTEWDDPDVELQQTRLIIKGTTKIVPGSAIQMIAGYEGKGKAAGSGGAIRKYDIWSRHSGNVNSEATIVVEWNHQL